MSELLTGLGPYMKQEASGHKYRAEKGTNGSPVFPPRPKPDPCRWDQPAELGFGLNVPDTISPRLEEEFPLDLLLHR